MLVSVSRRDMGDRSCLQSLALNRRCPFRDLRLAQIEPNYGFCLGLSTHVV
jgi:hypothetical protein